METVEEEDWLKGSYVAVAIIDRTMAVLSAQFQFVAEDYEQDGLGAARGKLMRTATGRQFILQQLLQAPEPWNRQTTIDCLQDDMPAQHLDDILKEMMVKPEELTWLHPEIEKAGLFGSVVSGSAVPKGSIPSPE